MYYNTGIEVFNNVSIAHKDYKISGGCDVKCRRISSTRHMTIYRTSLLYCGSLLLLAYIYSKLVISMVSDLYGIHV